MAFVPPPPTFCKVRDVQGDLGVVLIESGQSGACGLLNLLLMVLVVLGAGGWSGKCP